MRIRHLLIVPAAVVVVSAVAWSRPAPSVGAPWLSLELPANALNAETQDAALVVRLYYHETPAIGDMQGRAEGLIDGERRSVPLEFEKTSQAGVYAVPQTWPAEGDWVLTISGASGATLLVALGPDGGLSPHEYYNRETRIVSIRSAQMVAGDVSDAQIDGLLRQHIASTGTP